MKITFTKLLSISVFLLPGILPAQSYTSYFTGNTTDTITQPLGGVCVMGGATENDEAMRWFLHQSNGGDILVLRASGSDGYNTYLYSELGVSVHSVESIVCNDATASIDPYVLQKIQQAEGIWFAGGDQWDYVSYWRNTAVDSLVNLAISERHVVVGGTSAGMAILGTPYFSAQNGSVTSAVALSNPYDPLVAVDTTPFLNVPYLAHTVTDTHYDNPNRKGRHVTFLARAYKDTGIPTRGIACDEYTAVCIDTAGIGHVYGDYPNNDDNAYFIQPNCAVAEDSPEICEAGQKLTWYQNGDALAVYQIKGTPNGDYSFDVNTWSTGTGGEWRRWYVQSGALHDDAGTQPDCSATGTTDGLTDKSTFHLFPNPTRNGQVTLSWDGLAPLSVEVYDTFGILRSRIYPTSATSVVLDLTGIGKGMVFVKCFTSGGAWVEKVVLD